MTPIGARLANLQELRALSERLKQMVREFLNKWREKAKGEISNNDVVRFNLEWLDIMALKQLLDKEAQRLGVDVSNN